METRFIKPREGLLVRDPVSLNPLPETGLEVPWSTFWRRRVKCGDVFIPKEEVQEEPAEEAEIVVKPKRQRK